MSKHDDWLDAAAYAHQERLRLIACRARRERWLLFWIVVVFWFVLPAAVWGLKWLGVV